MSKFQQDLKGDNVCMMRLDIYNKGCCQLPSNETYFSGGWFSYVKTAEVAMAAGVDYCGPENTSHTDFVYL